MRTLVLLSLLAACSDPEEPNGDATPNGTTAVIEESGRLAVTLPGGQVFAFAPQPSRLETFDIEYLAPVGIWTFTHGDAETVEFPDLTEESFSEGVFSFSYGNGTETLDIEIKDASEVSTTITLTPSTSGHTAQVVRLSCNDGNTFHGWGEQYNATDQRGEAFELFVSEQGIGRRGGSARPISGDSHTTYFPMPWMIDARGYGVLFETDNRVRVDLCAANKNVAEVQLIDDAPATLTIFHGPTPKDVVQQLGDELGRPDGLPEWAFRPWLSAQGGTDAVRAEYEALVAADIPVGAIWSQDWTGIRRNFSGGFGVQYRWEADPELYPGLADWVAELHEDDVRFLAYANPFIDPNLPNHFDELDEAGLLVTNPEGESYIFNAPNLESGHADFSIEAARDYTRDAMKKMITDYDFDGWMVDFAEWTPLDANNAEGIDPVAFHNRYPEMWQRLTREAFEELRPDGDWVSFARSGWTGTQDVSKIHWVGDQEADFEPEDGIRTVIPAMINLGLAGIPYVTHDIAGFSGGPSSKELFQRWTELGAFTPIFRTHDGDDKLNNWRWSSDEETTEHFRRFAKVHEALRPEWTALTEEASQTSAPIIRHLMLEYPDDKEAWSQAYEYLIGDSLLVAPVYEEEATSRELYLPEGTWFHIWTGESYEGPATITVDAPIGSPPVFSLGEDRPDLREIE